MQKRNYLKTTKRYCLQATYRTTLLAIFLLSLSCKEEQIVFGSAPVKLDRTKESAKLGALSKFNASKFHQLIYPYMSNKVAGFGYSVAIEGSENVQISGGGGWARKPFESKPLEHNELVNQEIVKMTQYVTAVAVLRVLQKYDIPLSTLVFYYLPTNWMPTEDFKNLTFERLLAHKTGLYSYNDIQKAVETPLIKDVYLKETRQDSDINYKLLALLVAKVHAVEQYKKGNEHLNKVFNSLKSSGDIYAFASSIFRDFVRAEVFSAAGLVDPSRINWRAWNHSGDLNPESGSKGYPAKLGNAPGLLKENNTQLDAGATGLYLSTSQFVNLQYAVNHLKVIKDEQLITTMKEKLLGYDGKLMGTEGIYYYKKGEGKNCETIIIDFGKVQIAVFANSPESEISDPTVLANMFEKSLEKDQIGL